jgi:hypothetical protein
MLSDSKQACFSQASPSLSIELNSCQKVSRSKFDGFKDANRQQTGLEFIGGRGPEKVEIIVDPRITGQRWQ